MRLRRAGHILGAASVQLDWAGTTIVFSGDLGRYDDANHGRSGIGRARRLSPGRIDLWQSPARQGAIRQTPWRRSSARRSAAAARWSFPAFAVGRAQSLLFHFQQLKSRGQLSNVPIFLDSPMAIDASEIFCKDVEGSQACRRPSAGVPVPSRTTSAASRNRRRSTANPDAEGDHLRKRNGDRRTRAAPSQALRARPEKHHSVRRLSGRRNPRRRDDGGRGQRSRSTANMCRFARR